MIWFTFLAVVVLIVLAAGCSGIETAFIAASPAKLQRLKNKGNLKAKKVIQLLKTKEKVISTFLIAYSAIITIATTLTTSLFIGLYGDELGTLVSSIFMSVIIIVFAEVIPKAIAVSKAEKISLFTESLVNIAIRIFLPINYLLERIVKFFYKSLNIDLMTDVTPQEEVRGIIEHHHSEGKVFKTDKDMIDGVLNIRNLTLSDVMVHRSQIKTIEANPSTKEMLAQALSLHHSRIPIWENNSENIVGVLNVRNLINTLYSNNFMFNEILLKNFIMEPWFVPENALVTNQLGAFKKKKNHLALVINEYGDLKGIVTLEDIVEEIVGTIDDEHETSNAQITKKGKNKFIIDGSTTIRDINRELEWNLPENEANTIAGFLIYHIGRIPDKGERFVVCNLRITIRKKTLNQIKTVFVEALLNEG